jgi:putative drug exporter of the RND superfamily
MSSLTRWVLAHKRTVVIGWLVLTVAGIMAAGPASRALDQKFSVPDKEGWETNVAIADKYNGTGGDTAPLVPVTTLPQGETVNSPGVKGDLEQIDAKLHEALPGARIASYSSTGNDAFVSDDGRTTFALVYPTPDPDQQFGQNPQAERAASAALEGNTVAGSAVHLTGFDALQEESGGSDGPGVLLEAVLGGLGALLVLTFVFASFLAISPRSSSSSSRWSGSALRSTTRCWWSPAGARSAPTGTRATKPSSAQWRRPGGRSSSAASRSRSACSR